MGACRGTFPSPGLPPRRPPAVNAAARVKGKLATFPDLGGAHGLRFSPGSVLEPRRVSDSSPGTRGLFLHLCLPPLGVCGSLGKILPVSLARHSLQLLFLGFSPVSSHRGKKKKRSRMFGKICRSVEHFLHWCKRRGGQRRRGGRGRVELRVPAPGRSPTPHVPLLGRGAISRFLSILDPFSGPATFALGQAPVIPPQQSLLSSTKHRSPASPLTAKHRSPQLPRPPASYLPPGRTPAAH